MLINHCFSDHSPAKARRISGFTLIESMVVLVILAVLASVATPTVGDLVQKQRVKAATDTVMSDLQFARIEAIRRDATVEVEMIATADGTHIQIRSGDTLIRESRLSAISVDFTPNQAVQRLRFNSLGALLDDTTALTLATSDGQANTLTLLQSGTICQANTCLGVPAQLAQLTLPSPIPAATASAGLLAGLLSPILTATGALLDASTAIVNALLGTTDELLNYLLANPALLTDLLNEPDILLTILTSPVEVALAELNNLTTGVTGSLDDLSTNLLTLTNELTGGALEPVTDLVVDVVDVTTDVVDAVVDTTVTVVTEVVDTTTSVLKCILSLFNRCR